MIAYVEKTVTGAKSGEKDVGPTQNVVHQLYACIGRGISPGSFKFSSEDAYGKPSSFISGYEIHQ